MTLEQLKKIAEDASKGVTQYYPEIDGATILKMLEVIEAAKSLLNILEYKTYDREVYRDFDAALKALEGEE